MEERYHVYFVAVRRLLSDVLVAGGGLLAGKRHSWLGTRALQSSGASALNQLAPLPMIAIFAYALPSLSGSKKTGIARSLMTPKVSSVSWPISV